MQEEKIIVQTKEEYKLIDVEEDGQGIIEESDIKYIEVDEPESIVVEISEAFAANGDSGGITQHSQLNGRDAKNQHPISAIDKLQGILDRLSEARDVYSIHGGYAEFQQWKKDGIYKKEVYRETDNGSDMSYKATGGVGFFVSLVTETGATSGGNLRIDICKKINNDNSIEAADVYGVTVDKSGFCGNQSAEYDLLESNSPNKNNPDYAKVCLLGNVDVRVSAQEHMNINIGDYVIPNEIGYAKKSENNVGFKVISKGQKESLGSGITAWYYVNIALVPQNDNIARVMEELEKANVVLENVNIKLDTMSGTVNDIVNIGISDKFQGIENVINNNKVETDKQIQAVQDVSKQAQEVVAQAEKNMTTMASQYVEAVNKARDALETLYGTDDKPGVLQDIQNLQENMDILAKWPEEIDTSQEFGVAGFVAQAKKNKIQLASLTTAFGDNGTNVTAIIQKIDEQGAAIQHLVTHVDKYILGEQSPIEGLTLEQTGFIQPGTIYVPTHDYEYYEDYKVKVGDQEETIRQYFVRGKSYIWATSEDPRCKYMWKEDRPVSLSTDNINGESDGDLWYCWQGIYGDDDKIIREPGVLYRWTKTETKITDEETGVSSNKHIWVPVASMSDSATAIGSVNQTAKNFQVAYTDMQGKLASLEVTVDGISTVVENEVRDKLSTIDQTAEEIMMGIYNTSDSDATSLGLLLSGMTSTSTNVNIKRVREVLEKPPVNVVKYENAPMWDGSKFVAVGDPSDEGTYYFDPNDTEPFTYYCEAAEDKYYVYGINNIAMANLSTRVTNTESEVESWTRFQKGQNETMTSINQTSDEAGSSISSMVYGDFRECVEIKLELTDEDKTDLPASRYAQQPKWNKTDEKFEFTDIEKGTEYCLSNSDPEAYYKLLYRDGEVIGYEKYKMKSSPYSAIVANVNDKQSSVGLVSGNDDAIGSIFVNTINNKSEVLISADKIGINGTAVFSDRLGNGTSTISGDYIRTGVLTSNNYNGPVTYKKYGAKIENNKIVDGVLSDCIWYSPMLENVEYELLPFDGTYTYYIGETIEPDTTLNQLNIEQARFTANNTGYVVSETYFDLAKKIGEYQGTKFDLNNGTIFSKNLSLNKNGDLTISGRITATSGYIGNEDNGFFICCVGLRHTVGDDEEALQTKQSGDSTVSYLPTGDYYFTYNDNGVNTYYSFSIDKEVPVGSCIIVVLEENKMYTSNGVSSDVKIATVQPNGPTSLTSTYTSSYSLSNSQWLYMGDGTKTPGVYLGTDGIGLGNGNFYVSNEGHLNTYGNVTMCGTQNIVDSEGNPTGETQDIELVKIEDGSLKLTGNITLGGAITWDMKNSPVKARYSSVYDPNSENEDDKNPDNDLIWHEGFKTGDKYMQISFDGGKNWGTPIKVVGDDGKKGEDGDDGTDAEVNDETVFNVLTNNGNTQGIFPFYRKSEYDNTNTGTQLYINATYIQSGTLSGLKFASADNGTYIQMGDGTSNYADFTLYRVTNNTSNAIFKIMDEQSIIAFKAMGDNYFMTTSGTTTYAKGTWDFSDAKVTGLSSTGVVPVFGE